MRLAERIAGTHRLGRYRGMLFGGDEGLVDSRGEPLDSASALAKAAFEAIARLAGAPAA